MARYVLLRIDDDRQTDNLLMDMVDYPDADLLTPCQENLVYARLDSIPDTDDGEIAASVYQSVKRSEQLHVARARNPRLTTEELHALPWPTS